MTESEAELSGQLQVCVRSVTEEGVQLQTGSASLWELSVPGTVTEDLSSGDNDKDKVCRTVTPTFSGHVPRVV